MGRNHCQWHGPSQWHGPKCRGNRRDGARCKSLAKEEFDWLYCCADHDPRLPTSTPTEAFRVKDLRESKGRIVKEYRERKDVYINQSLMRGRYYEMDHVVEIHLVRDAYDSVKLHGTAFRAKKEKLRLSLTDAVNEIENLTFTSPLIDNLKFEAIRSFQEDHKNEIGRQQEEGLFPYLQEGLQEGCNLSRSVSRNIQRELLAWLHQTSFLMRCMKKILWKTKSLQSYTRISLQ